MTPFQFNVTMCLSMLCERRIVVHLLKPKSNLKMSVGVGKTLSNPPTADYFTCIKEMLTYDNPEYLAVKKYSRYGYTKVPESLMYYKSTKEGLVVPRGVKVLEKGDIVDNTVVANVSYPEFKLNLRATQKKAAESYLDANTDVELLNGLIQMPTGKGKSILGTYLAYALKQRTLIVVHKDDLVKGWQSDIDLCFEGKLKTGLIKAKKFDIGEQITIATIQTLSKLDPEKLNALVSKFGFVILDECHHCPSTSYSVIQNFPARYLLGLTATPERSDGLTHVMNLYLGDFAYRYDLDIEAIEEEEDILPVSVKIIDVPVECMPICRKIPSNKGEKYEVISFDTQGAKVPLKDQIKLSTIPYSKRPQVSYLSLDDFVVKHDTTQFHVLNNVLKEYNEGHSCLVFVTQISHVDLYFDLFVEAVGIDNVSKYYGNNKTNDLTKIVAENKRRHITIATYKKATEGTNVKQWEVVFLVSSMNDGKNVEQAVGRIRRTKEGKINPVRVYDFNYLHCYSLANHIHTRKQRYNKLGCDILKSQVKRKIIGKGFSQHI